MEADRWTRLKELFNEARALPVSERDAYLSDKCGDDMPLREELHKLLAADEEAAHHLEEIRQGLPLSNLVGKEENQLQGDPHRLIGRTLAARYRVQQWLGGGGMGVVYRARDLQFDRPVALKFLPRELSRDPEAIRRFQEEARAAGVLSHANVCTIHEIGKADDGQLFIVMAYCDGETLKKKIARGPLSVEEAVDYARQAASGLAKAHSRGIIHRDVKPANLMVSEDGVVKVVDFGIAKFMDATQHTQPGSLVGTCAYMSPEQLQGGPVDGRTDVWALGVVLFEMLAGQRPFVGAHELALMHNIQHEPPQPFKALRPDVPDEIVRVVGACLEKDPERRYRRIDEVRTDLEQVQRSLRAKVAVSREAVPAVTSHSLVDRLAFLLRHPWRYGTSIAALVAFLLGLLMPGVFGPQLPDEKQLAVLPFRNVGGNPENAAYCDGLVETLTSKLGQLERFTNAAFWVTPANQVLTRGVTSAEEARKAFGVNLVLEGSVQRDKEKIRLTINLIDARTLKSLDSKVIDLPATIAMDVQDEATIQAARMLNVALKPEAHQIVMAGGTMVPGANEYYLQGLGYLRRYNESGNLEKSIELFEQAIDQDSAYALAYAGLGEAYWRKYEASSDVQWVEPAVKYCQRAVRLDNRLAPVQVTLGYVYTGTGKYTEALQAFRHALELDPFNAEAYRGRSRTYEAQGELQAAEASLEEAIQLKPDYWAGFNDLGVFYFRMADYEKAADQFEIVAKLTPQNTWGLLNLGSAYYYLDRIADAVEIFEQIAVFAPDQDAFSNLATAYFYEGRFGDAARTYEKALELLDTDYRLWGYLATAYYWMPGERERAYDLFRQAVDMAKERRQINPKDASVLVSLAGYHIRLGEEEMGKALIEIAIEEKPTAPDVMFEIGYLYEQLGGRGEALDWISRAVANGYLATLVARTPGLDALRSDVRYRQVLDSLNQ